MSLRLTAYGEFNCEFDDDSQERGCSDPVHLSEDLWPVTVIAKSYPTLESESRIRPQNNVHGWFRPL